ncbi:MAG: SET domain-containing protein [Anaerolineae bacterium]|nr:SET domain-containing protein [Anaerolineae bacterium]
MTHTTFMRNCWCSSKLERRATPPYGYGLFATAPIAKGELLAVWGGSILSTADLRQQPEFVQDHAIQVEEDHNLCCDLKEDADYVNHSCNPNAGLQGQITLVAMRAIAVGEEITFDYAMSDAHPTFYMKCACGQPECRHEVTGNDWQRPDLQQRYKGYFSPYIQRKIDAGAK